MFRTRTVEAPNVNRLGLRASRRAGSQAGIQACTQAERRAARIPETGRKQQNKTQQRERPARQRSINIGIPPWVAAFHLSLVLGSCPFRTTVYCCTITRNAYTGQNHDSNGRVASWWAYPLTARLGALINIPSTSRRSVRPCPRASACTRHFGLESVRSMARRSRFPSPRSVGFPTVVVRSPLKRLNLEI